MLGRLADLESHLQSSWNLRKKECSEREYFSRSYRSNWHFSLSKCSEHVIDFYLLVVARMNFFKYENEMKWSFKMVSKKPVIIRVITANI